MALDPTDLDVLGNAAAFLQSLGRLDEALALEEALVRRDPVNVTALFNLGYDQRELARYDAAIASLPHGAEPEPGRRRRALQIGMALLLKGDASAALAEIEQENNETGG